jgi:hypothetical protein
MGGKKATSAKEKASARENAQAEAAAKAKEDADWAASGAIVKIIHMISYSWKFRVCVPEENSVTGQRKWHLAMQQKAYTPCGHAADLCPGQHVMCIHALRSWENAHESSGLHALHMVVVVRAMVLSQHLQFRFAIGSVNHNSRLPRRREEQNGACRGGQEVESAS